MHNFESWLLISTTIAIVLASSRGATTGTNTIYKKTHPIAHATPITNITTTSVKKDANPGYLTDQLVYGPCKNQKKCKKKPKKKPCAPRG